MKKSLLIGLLFLTACRKAPSVSVVDFGTSVVDSDGNTIHEDIQAISVIKK